ncbi:expressed protein [Echinococcus multilocularis]|uniref:Expressed protein n=1 Tax=Echinococcus multilocularis TaxID=6211 RepID=A0A068YEI6_ECHMU|nr:expressed protein [Echinococcus multilocularis]
MTAFTVNVVVPAFSCVVFCILYVFIIQPTVFHIFGLQQPGADRSIERMKPISQQESEYSQRHIAMPKKKDRDPGIVATILPFYAFGIFIYLVYTVVKLLNNRRKVKSTEKEKYLKDYYRNFCYVSEKGKFKKDSDSSDDEHGNGLRKFRTPCDIGWSSAPKCSNATSNVCRSVADLPNDLEYLLKKADEDNLDDVEITRLRTLLEQMEIEMTRLLEAVNSSATLLTQSCSERGISEVMDAQCTDAHSDDNEALFSAEEN